MFSFSTKLLKLKLTSPWASHQVFREGASSPGIAGTHTPKLLNTRALQPRHLPAPSLPDPGPEGMPSSVLVSVVKGPMGTTLDRTSPGVRGRHGRGILRHPEVAHKAVNNEEVGGDWSLEAAQLPSTHIRALSS